jgi:hypothetical protein
MEVLTDAWNVLDPNRDGKVDLRLIGRDGEITEIEAFLLATSGGRRRWLSRAIPELARRWYGSTWPKPLAARPGCYLASRPPLRGRLPSRHLMTCSATLSRKSSRRFQGLGGEPWRSHFSAT